MLKGKIINCCYKNLKEEKVLEVKLGMASVALYRLIQRICREE